MLLQRFVRRFISGGLEVTDTYTMPRVMRRHYRIILIYYDFDGSPRAAADALQY
jgi:hypothetical protein